jgi:hypothetical protein
LARPDPLRQPLHQHRNTLENIMSRQLLKMPHSATPPPSRPETFPPAGVEQWVGWREVAAHLHFSYAMVRRMSKEGVLPGQHFRCGKKTYWRTKLSMVDAALEKQAQGETKSCED